MHKLAFLAIALATTPAAALVPLYPNSHSVNSSGYNFAAEDAGELRAYFSDSSASYTSELGLKVNGVDRGIVGLKNKAAAPGEFLSFGEVNSGDLLNFYINVLTTGQTFYSNASDNADGINHVYSTSYEGNDFGMPNGTYISFEDRFGGGDKDYNDVGYVFKTVAPLRLQSAVPEPAAWGLMLTGFGLVGWALRRRRQKLRVNYAAN